MTCSAGAAETDLTGGIRVNASVISVIATRLTTLRPRLVLMMFMGVSFPFESRRLTASINDTPVHEGEDEITSAGVVYA